MRYYPLLLDVRGRFCVVIGGGEVAERKALALLDAGADVTVVSPLLTPKLSGLQAAGTIVCRIRTFEEQDLNGAFLVIAATDDAAVNTAAAALCRSRNVLVNVAAPPEEGVFIVPSLVSRGDLLIAVSTSGSSPALSRKIRRELEEQYGPEYKVFLEMLGDLRRQLHARVPDEDARRRILQEVVESDVLQLLRQGGTKDVEKRMGEIAGLGG